MHLTRNDYLKKALLDTQERVRDYMHYASKLDSDPELSRYFQEFAEVEANHATNLQRFLSE